jgi:HTH-type transcriptional regulator/antitoxin HigA
MNLEGHDVSMADYGGESRRRSTMEGINSIRTEADYQAALARICALMDAQPGTAEGEELDLLTNLVERYELKHEPMGVPRESAAIRFRMEQAKEPPCRE